MTVSELGNWLTKVSMWSLPWSTVLFISLLICCCCFATSGLAWCNSVFYCIPVDVPVDWDLGCHSLQYQHINKNHTKHFSTGGFSFWNSSAKYIRNKMMRQFHNFVVYLSNTLAKKLLKSQQKYLYNYIVESFAIPPHFA